MKKKSGLNIKSNNKNKLFIIVSVLVFFVAVLSIWWFVIRKPATNDKPLVSQSATPTVDETEITKEDKDNHNVPAENPRFISIPALGIDKSRVVQIGLIGDTKQLDSPISIFDTGWYEASAKPGIGAGALLLDGHNGGPSKGGVYDKLGDLEVGSEIIVERGDGKKFTYKVTENNQVTLEQANDKNHKSGMAAMTRSSDPSKQGLNIITCVGNWLPDQKTFDQRVMLRAVLSD